MALSRRPDAEGDMLPASDGSRADRRSTFRTKHLNALVTAFSRLEVLLWLSRQKLELLLLYTGDRPEGRPRYGLAVGAVANPNLLGIEPRK
jgi:hypothetical protein